jgi:hypothetical protein
MSKFYVVTIVGILKFNDVIVQQDKISIQVYTEGELGIDFLF